MAGDLKVFVQDLATGAMVPGIPRPPAYVTGIEKLLQIVALTFLNNGDRSIFRPEGGGMRQLIGGNIDPEDASELFADLQLVNNRVMQIVKEGQVNTNRPPSERLSSLHLLDVIPDEEAATVRVVVNVVNEEGVLAPAIVVMP